MTKLLMTALLLTQTLPTGYWPLEKSQPIIDKTQTIRLSSDLSKLSEGERKAVAKLIEAGQIFQSLYEQQRHPEALASYRALVDLDKRTGSTPATSRALCSRLRPCTFGICTPVCCRARFARQCGGA